MALTNKQKTALNFKAFYEGILPYLNGECPTFANAFNKSDLYSTDEKIIGSWIDGKPLYQKTFIFTNYTLTTLDSWTLLVDVPDLHISNSCCFITNSYYVSSAGNFTNTNQIATMSGGSNAYTKSFAIAFDTRHLTSEFSANDCLNIITSVALSNVTLGFTLRYTKTTDSAIKVGNGNDYSMDEQIIGTWIDGSVLYQKTVVTGGSVPSGATLIERIVQTGYDTLRYTKSS